MLNSTGNSMNPYATTNPIQTTTTHFPSSAHIESLLPYYNNTHQYMSSEPIYLQQLAKSALNVTATGCGAGNPPPPPPSIQLHNHPDDSGLTFNNSSTLHHHLPAKRNRDSTSCAATPPLVSASASASMCVNNNNNNKRSGSILSVGHRPVTASSSVRGGGTGMSFLGEDLSLQMMQSQLEIDRMITLHMEKVRIEMETRRRKQLQRIIDTIEQAIVKKLRDKEDQVDKIGKINWALEERIKSLYMENQIWRDLAQTNEATANALRSNLEQVLAQANNHNNLYQTTTAAATAAAAAPLPRTNFTNTEQEEEEDGGVFRGRLDMTADEAESCCGSTSGCGGDNDDDEVEGGGRWKKVARREDDVGNNYSGNNCDDSKRRMCKRCGDMESSVLLLPCRHLCVCAACGPYIDTCPICNSVKSASVHVNLS